MKRTIKQSVDEFRTHWKNYVLQSILATGVVFTVLVFLSVQNNAVIIASIGATTFIVCAMPNNLTAKPRNIIGGYIVSLVCGITCAIIPYPGFLPPLVSSSVIYAVAVGLSIFIMVVTDTEHPPCCCNGSRCGPAKVFFMECRSRRFNKRDCPVTDSLCIQTALKRPYLKSASIMNILL